MIYTILTEIRRLPQLLTTIALLLAVCTITSCKSDPPKEEEGSPKDTAISIQPAASKPAKPASTSYTAGTPEQNIESIVQRLINYRNKFDTRSLEKLYADTVTKYFKDYQNITKEEITKTDNRHWGQYPNEVFKTSGPIIVTPFGPGYKARVRGQQCDPAGCQEELLEIHFNRNNKINYIAASYTK